MLTLFTLSHLSIAFRDLNYSLGCSPLPTHAYPVPAFPGVYSMQAFGVGQETEGVSPLNPQSVSLPTQQLTLDRDLTTANFGRNQLSPVSIGFSPLRPGYEEHLLVAPLRASTLFYQRFTLPRIRSTGFGSYPGDSRHFHTSALIACGCSLSLRYILYRSYLSPHRYTPWLVIQNGRYTPKMRATTIPCRFQVFSLPVKGSFQRSLTVLFAIGLESYLRLEVVVPRIHANFQGTVLWISKAVQLPAFTGLSPSLAAHSSALQLIDWLG
jgi:hypothetical protein